jgi:5'-phosphate synthase pdxT subunit
MARVGVLALQGGFAAHAAALVDLGVDAVEVRRTERLERLDGLIVPGGESTTLLNLMRDEPWFDALSRFHGAGGALFGTCAGAILLSREVRAPRQPSLGLLDAVIERNGYGRQVDSFETLLMLEGSAEPLPAVFIRAPRFCYVGPAVRVLARLGNEPVLVRQDNVLAATFHPELTADRRLHRVFLKLIDERQTAVASTEAAALAAPGGPTKQSRRMRC